ncbi:hypothetical protein CSPAE12_07286 [Colletotrichum incanum]|nr:hypothetical protein CSPAE12_07286 [Colletotrichum incanum]
MSSGEGHVGTCQISVDPFNADTFRCQLSLTTEGLGETANLGSTGQTKLASVDRAPKTIDDYMNEDRARYIHSRTEDSQFDSQDSLAQVGGLLKTGSNTKSIGHRRCHDLYRPVVSYRGDDSYRPDDLYRPSQTRHSDISVHLNGLGRQENPEHQNERLSTYHANGSRRHEPSDRRNDLRRRESPGRWGEPRRREASSRPSGSHHVKDSHHNEGSKHRDLIKSKETVKKKAAGKKETTVCSVFKRKRSDGRLSPWDDIHPPAKKPRQQNPVAGGLPWDDIEAPRKKDQREPAGASNAKQVIVVDHEPAPSSNSKQAASSENVTKELGETTDAKWNQAEMEANVFLEAFGRGLVECPEPDASANSQVEGSCESPFYPPAWSAFCATQYHFSEDQSPGDGEDILMADILDEVAKSTRSMSCNIDEDPPRTDLVIVPFQTLKPLQRNPPYDSSVLDLFRGKENSHVYVNVSRRSNAVEMYVENEEERTTARLSHLTV